MTYYINKPAIKINFKDDVTMVDCLYVWNKSNAFSKVTQQFGKDIELMSITPDTLKFRFDKQAVKSVPVTLNALITFSPGYDLLKPIALTPDSIKIIGPEVLVQAITHIETDSLKLKGLKTEVQKPVTLKLPDNKAGNLKFAANTVTAHITVDKFTEGYLSVPVSIINLPEDVSIKFFPKKVNVSYYTSLASFNQISTKDFRVVCDYNQVLNGAGILTPKVVRQPEQVRHVKVDQKQIEFIIVK
ncbi:MAG: YbbR-like domain-containing protein [Algicola sp.]|nr:YbbR-like domain-containing protein [Algicola sp.]